ncbi:MAG TPA: glycosyltransferase family 9 protein [Chloroflexota bacterium]|nr:glycosyltransferase family 9 protein [Chloroflexota bacterium]
MPVPLRTSLVSAAGRALGTLFPRRPAPDPGSVRKLLVIKPAAHGDILFASASITALRRGYPRAELTLAVGQWFVELAQGIPGVDRIFDLGPFGTPGRYGPLEIVRAARRLRAEAFDVAVVLDRSPKVAIAPWLAGIRHRAGIDSSGRGFANTIRVPWDRPRHEVELMLDVVRALGAPVENPHLSYVPSEDHLRYADRLMQEWDLIGGAPVAVVHPGGASNAGMTMPSKRWPAARFAALADRLVVEAGARVVVVGHGTDAPIARQMRVAMKQPSVDLVGQTSIGQLAALLRRADLYVGNDSLPLHLGVAVGTPVIGIFGPTDPAINGPYRAAGAALVDENACSQRRPFVPGPLAACADCTCIQRVTVDRAFDAASSLLRARTAERTRAPESSR